MHPANQALSLPNWIAHVFDHPVARPRWHASPDAPEWHDRPEHIAMLVADTFEHSGELLARFSDAQLDQGFWYLLGGSDFMRVLVDPPDRLHAAGVTLRSKAPRNVLASVRFRALRSFVPLFEQVMAVRCSPHLLHLAEPGANPLNSACYMWWDMFPIHGSPDEPDRAEFDAEVLNVQRRILAIPHDACRESALHGLGHWALYYPRVSEIISEFLRHTRGLRPELVVYAEHAKTGRVQ
jgi:hypothetical protein